MKTKKLLHGMAHTVGAMESEKFGVKKIETLIDHVLTRYQMFSALTIPDTLTCVGFAGASQNRR